VRTPAAGRSGLVLASLLALQVGLGIANVLLSLPLPVAVAHNLGAALLVAALVTINVRSWH
jgi:heme a synthase